MHNKLRRTPSSTHHLTPSAIRTVGAILPAELLQRIINGDTTLEGLKPTDFHLSPGERLGEAATRAWNRMTGVWKTYKDIIDRLPQDAIGTTETRERWLLPLFQELGYGRLQTQKSLEIDGKLYPISHKAAEPVAIHLVSFKWDLDRRPTSPHSPLTPSPNSPSHHSSTHHSPSHHLPKSSPHSLIQEFVNRSKDHLWGFLSNGFKLRILRDNISLTRAAYVEFDLQAMMDNDAYSDFFLLYLLCHQSRVEAKTDESGRLLGPESCWLEKWYNTSITEGVRALDDLRANVQSAIESLGAGFIAYPNNIELRDKLRDGALSLQNYYHQVLRQVYRLLFVFVAEDRDLLLAPDAPDASKEIYQKYYSTYRIRELALRKRGTKHSDLWQHLDLLFNSLYDGNPALGLPALGSFLFKAESTPDLADCGLANSDLLSAFRYLCYTQKNNIFQPINYRNLGPEELGSVYESLLEMHPEINLEAGFFKLNIISGSERKTTGSYYTPASLVNCLLDSALEPVIAKAVSGKEVSSEWSVGSDSSSAPNSPLTSHHSPEQALLALKICDPACGSGHFLIAAAHRIAKRLAAIRAGEDEPAPSIIQHALRDVIGHCIYGVDINPMSVELCKISLWMEALEPGKPLTFLEHHIQCGNSLLGCTPALLKKGIPDAAFTALTGDDKAYCAKYKKQNKEESKGDVIDIFSGDEKPWEHLGNHAPYVINLNQMEDDSIENLTRKEEAYAEIMRSSAYLNSKFIYDAWCAAFVWEKVPSDTLPYPITQRLLDNIESNPYSVNPAIRSEIIRLAKEYQFFHWHIAFPDVFPPLTTHSSPLTPQGFDCVLGNPPWERVKLQEKEFFAARDAEIANAANASIRKKLIEALPSTNPALYRAFLAEKRVSEGSSLLIRESGVYPLCGRGDLNTYTVFAELNRNLLNPRGHCGCIVPSGIATDDTTKFFFQDLFDTGSLKSLYDFENREKLFPAVDSRMKFCLLTLRAASSTHHSPLTTHQAADFLFFAHSVADLNDAERHFQLSREDVALINPNTRTCPIFRTKQDAELTKYIYRRVPVLINENDPEQGNPWGISFMRMFDMSNDSQLFKTKEQMEDMGFELQGNRFIRVAQDTIPAGQMDSVLPEPEVYLPLYEAKMIHHYNHRFGDYADLPAGSNSTQLPNIPLSRLEDPNYEPLPRYWVKKDEVESATPDTKGYFLGFRDICRSTDERTIIASFITQTAVSNKMPLLLCDYRAATTSYLNACLNSFACDFVSRFKIGSTSLNFFIAKQLAVLPPTAFDKLDSLLTTHHLASSPSALLTTHRLPLTSLLLELIYTSYSMQAFAQDCGYDGPPFIWNEERRFEIRCELDALYFHLYLGTQEEWMKPPLTTHHSPLTTHPLFPHPSPCRRLHHGYLPHRQAQRRKGIWRIPHQTPHPGNLRPNDPHL
ncbi:MAG: hypothetical protein PHY48_08525 [Candidatus Cloacimonetes bacterium]|jgi:hypothetical protein|nr:hypothetical protein [Candidatus Cloacimonadota bacterium]